VRILGLIPARAGSKGIPGKNIKLLDGKPLIQYAIEGALESGSITKVAVSTDSQEIADISRNLGADVPFIRPSHLADDSSPTIDTVIHSLEYYQNQGEHFDAVCLLQTTHPFRTSQDIESSIKKFKVDSADTLISVIDVPHEFNPHWVFIKDAVGNFKIATGDEKIISRRQELPDAYIRNGAIYITQSSVLLKEKSLYGKRLSAYKMSSDNHVNLDTKDDWRRAEAIIKRCKFDNLNKQNLKKNNYHS
jgi:CMP-N,N'-diacetyllegionaminic acid synthase